MKRLFPFLRTTKGRYLAIGLVIFLAGWGFLRGCSHSKRGVSRPYTVAVDHSWYPLSIYGKEKNLLGFMMELFDAISEETDLRFSFRQVQTVSLLPSLDSQEYDSVISSLPQNATNQAKYQFSEPLYLLGPVILVKTSSPIESLNDLAGRFVGVQRGSSLNFDTPLPNITVLPYDNINSALGDLESNAIDAFIMGGLQAFVQIQGIYYGKIKIATLPLTREGFRLITLNTPSHKEFMEVFNQALLTLQESGKYDELISRWGFYNPISIKSPTHAEELVPQ